MRLLVVLAVLWAARAQQEISVATEVELLAAFAAAEVGVIHLTDDIVLSPASVVPGSGLSGLFSLTRNITITGPSGRTAPTDYYPSLDMHYCGPKLVVPEGVALTLQHLLVSKVSRAMGLRFDIIHGSSAGLVQLIDCFRISESCAPLDVMVQAVNNNIPARLTSVPGKQLARLHPGGWCAPAKPTADASGSSSQQPGAKTQCWDKVVDIVDLAIRVTSLDVLYNNPTSNAYIGRVFNSSILCQQVITMECIQKIGLWNCSKLILDAAALRNDNTPFPSPPPPRAPPSPPTVASTGVSAAVIGGAVGGAVGGVLLAAAVAALAVTYVRRRRQRCDSTRSMESPSAAKLTSVSRPLSSLKCGGSLDTAMMDRSSGNDLNRPASSITASVFLQMNSDRSSAERVSPAERVSETFSHYSGTQTMVELVSPPPRSSRRSSNGVSTAPKGLRRLSSAGPQEALTQQAGITDLQDEQLQLFEVLGRGGHSVVYRGVWKGLPVAAKMMVVQEDMHDEWRQQMLEATISSSLNHPHIVVTYMYDLKQLTFEPKVNRSGSLGDMSGSGCLTHAGSIPAAAAWQLTMLQELCTGGTLRHMIDRQVASSAALARETGCTPLYEAKLEHVLLLLVDISSGLEHLHNKNVVHADLTPNNVLLQAVNGAPRAGGLAWVAKVADFGLSVAFEEGCTHVSKMFAGTPYYIPPETQEHGIVSKQSDVFALGIIMYELLAGPVKPAIPPPKRVVTLSTLLEETLQQCPTSSGGNTTSASHQSYISDGSTLQASAPLHAGRPDSTPCNLVSTPTHRAAGGGCVHSSAPSNIIGCGASSSTILGTMGWDLASLDQHRNGEGASMVPPTIVLGGGGGRYGAAIALPPLPASVPPAYVALVSECLSPSPHSRPPILAVRQRLTALAGRHISGYVAERNSV